ncbi:MAG: HisA/HisF-related TIM barrel protein, partial [Nanoarchaeota archaeon]
VKNICKIAKCRVGGGIRNIETAKSIIQASAKSIIIGSSAFIDGRVNTEFLSELIKQISKKKIIIAIDSKKGKIVINGWKENTGIKTESVIEELEDFCSGFLYTYVDKEGMMQGTNIEFLKKLRPLTKNEITAAGGISSINEIEELERLGINSALGMSLYTGKIKFEELVDFNNQN